VRVRVDLPDARDAAVVDRNVGDTFSLSRFAEGRELGSAFGGNRA
jgi:hypothetical protein